MVVMTYEIAMAAGWDAANRNMQKAGRNVWAREDVNVAAAEVERVYPIAAELADRYKGGGA